MSLDYQHVCMHREAILAAPGDATPRLVAADYWEECGLAREAAALRGPGTLWYALALRITADSRPFYEWRPDGHGRGLGVPVVPLGTGSLTICDHCGLSIYGPLIPRPGPRWGCRSCPFIAAVRKSTVAIDRLLRRSGLIDPYLDAVVAFARRDDRQRA